jgi:ferric-dicitrate binding protein FerR (iron transport regulator)
VTVRRGRSRSVSRACVPTRPLGEIVADLNRRYRRPFVLSPRAAGKRLSGVIALDDQAAVARRLAAYLSLTVRAADLSIALN